MTTINGQLQDICEAHGISLHCSASKDGVQWHAVQIREAISETAKPFTYDMRSAPYHGTIDAAVDAAVDAVMSMEWELAK